MKKLFIILAVLALLSGCAGTDTAANAPAAQEPAAQAAPAEDTAESSALSFSTLDLEGKEWNESALAEHSLVMLNFWEYWCGPCVGEMPDLQRLQDAYADKGFLILGIYSTNNPDEVAAVQAETGVQYPLLQYVSAFDAFQTGYVPTTVFLNGAGEPVGQIYVGSRSYEEWSKIVEGLL